MKRFLVPLFAVLLLSTLQAEEPETIHYRDRTFDYRSEDTLDLSREFSPWRFAAMASLTSASFIAAYVFVFEKGWWDNEESSFHFENDFEYALNLDKLGHFMGGVLLSEVFYEGYRWSGVSEGYSYLFSGISASLVHVGIDIKDGYSPEWGFSIFDVLAGTLGGFYPMAKRYIPAFKYFDVKMSYWMNSKAYFRQSETDIVTDDYVNQTYWLSLKIHRLLPASIREYYPMWLAFAAGVSVNEDTFIRGRKGKREVYLALDYDFEAFRPKSRLARQIVKFVNYIKFPAPTVQIYPERKFFWLYPIRF
ncbi:MAG: YfiM family protein [Fibrobacter sp.]|nr:YfiM family protein [Fibrobacter sp.]